MDLPLWGRTALAGFLLLGGGPLPVRAARPGSSPAARPAVLAVKPIDTAGMKQEIAKRKGKVVLLNIWASWCPPCVASYPELVKFGRAYASRGLEVISISVDDPGTLGSKVEPFLRRQNPGFATYIKKPGSDEAFIRSVHPYWRGLLPADVVIGPDGRRVALLIGQTKMDLVKRWVDRELALAPRGRAAARTGR